MGYVLHNCDVVEVLYGICAVLMWLRHRDDAEESLYIAEITINLFAGAQPNASAVTWMESGLSAAGSRTICDMLLLNSVDQR